MAGTAAATLRAQGWTTIAALTEKDDALAMQCTHHLINGEATPI